MPPTTMTIEQANHHVEELLDDSFASLPNELDHKVQYRERRTSCAKSGTDSPSGLVRASLDYQITSLEKSDIPKYFSMLRKWWTAHNFRILEDTPKRVSLGRA